MQGRLPLISLHMIAPASLYLVRFNLLPNTLNQNSIPRMHLLRLILTSFLSLAILSVGSAAVAMSIHSPCEMQQMQAQSAEVMQAAMPMMAMDQDDQPDMSDMDCQKVDQSHNSLCKTGQDCVMYHVHLAYPASSTMVLQPIPQYQSAQIFTAQSSEFVPTPDLFGLWRPPRAL